jgi:hypothetical protein
MKPVAILLIFTFIFSSCDTVKSAYQRPVNEPQAEEVQMTHSLFSDKSATISEEGIQKTLNGNYKLPAQLRVAIVRLDPAVSGNSYQSYWRNEEYLKMQQSYLDVFTEKLQLSPRVTRISVVPELLISKTPSFTNIREAAVRMQADVVVVYSITSDIYSRSRLFSKTDIKAFATTQLIMMDVKTGLVPFSAVVTKDYLSKRKKEELEDAEARNRARHEAVLLTIFEIGQRIADFLKPAK